MGYNFSLNTGEFAEFFDGGGERRNFKDLTLPLKKSISKTVITSIPLTILCVWVCCYTWPRNHLRQNKKKSIFITSHRRRLPWPRSSNKPFFLGQNFGRTWAFLRFSLHSCTILSRVETANPNLTPGKKQCVCRKYAWNKFRFCLSMRQPCSCKNLLHEYSAAI